MCVHKGLWTVRFKLINMLQEFMTEELHIVQQSQTSGKSW